MNNFLPPLSEMVVSQSPTMDIKMKLNGRSPQQMMSPPFTYTIPARPSISSHSMLDGAEPANSHIEFSFDRLWENWEKPPHSHSQPGPSILPRPPSPPSHVPPQNLNPSSYYCLSKKNAAGSLSHTISQDCTNEHLVRRKRLCAFDGPASLKKHHGLDSRSSPLFKLGDSSEGGNHSLHYSLLEFFGNGMDSIVGSAYAEDQVVQSDLDKKANRETHSKAFRNTTKMANSSQANDESFRQSSLAASQPLRRPAVHDRPWKCPVTTCKYHHYGWPTAKEMERHHSVKHPDKPVMYKCLFDPCPYMSKRESNCKQHMEKAHGWTYVRSKKEDKQTNAPMSEKLKPIPFPDRSEFGEQISESAPGESLRFGSPALVQRSYPEGLKFAPGLEALASRRASLGRQADHRKPLFSVQPDELRHTTSLRHLLQNRHVPGDLRQPRNLGS
ncbi:hypothetical protein V8F06_014837 [Rhypophila decipiens]